MATSKIEWLASDGMPGMTWNPVTGCTPISPGCAHCYARAMARRLAGRCGYPADEPFRVTAHPERALDPLHWRKPRRIFISSMGDLFHEEVPTEFLDRIMAVVAMMQEHTFIALTKRPDRMLEYFADPSRRLEIHRWWCTGGMYRAQCDHGEIPETLWPLPNLWLGITAEDQQRANERIPVLLQTPAAVRFVSVEPMLESVDLSPWLRSLDWVICGCETGPQARPMEVDWVRDLRDQCQEAGVPFFLKAMRVDGKVVKLPELDGRKWNQVPERRQQRRG